MKPGCGLAGTKFEKAKATVRESAAGPSKDSRPRCRSSQHLQSASLTQASLKREEPTTTAVSLMNVGDYVTAREHIRRSQAIAENRFRHLRPRRLDCLTGHVETR